MYHGDGDDWLTVLGGHDDDDDDVPFWTWLRSTLWLGVRVFFLSTFITPLAQYIWSFMHYAVPHF